MCRPSLPARIARSLAAIAPIIGHDVGAVQNVLAPLVKLDDVGAAPSSRSAFVAAVVQRLVGASGILELTTGLSRGASFPLRLQLPCDLSFFPLLSKSCLRIFKAGSRPAGNAVSWKAAIPQPDFRVRLTGAHDPANRISVFDHGVLIGRNRAQDEVVGSARLGRVRLAIAPPLLDQTEKKNKTRNKT